MYAANRKLRARIEAAWYFESAALPKGLDFALRALSLGWQTAVATARRLSIRRSLGVPTVGISSMVVGGSGKTPLARWVALLCQGAGMSPAVVTRGYGGALRGPIRVEPGHHGAADVGDEPLWLALNLSGDIPVIVARRRVEGCFAAMKNWEADVLILDDALMLFSLHRDLELMILGSSSWLGNGRFLPAGPLRANPRGLTGADAIFLLDEPGEVHPDAIAFLHNPPDRMEVFRASLLPTVIVGPDGRRHEMTFLKDRPLVAWGGIARWWRFRDLIRNLGGKLCAFIPFPDHHLYGEEDLSLLDQAVRRHNATPLTTAKDMTRWPSTAAWRPYHLVVELEVAERNRASEFIRTRMMEMAHD